LRRAPDRTQTSSRQGSAAQNARSRPAYDDAGWDGRGGRHLPSIHFQSVQQIGCL
jgi:hypothetical protein